MDLQDTPSPTIIDFNHPYKYLPTLVSAYAPPICLSQLSRKYRKSEKVASSPQQLREEQKKGRATLMVRSFSTNRFRLFKSL